MSTRNKRSELAVLRRIATRLSLAAATLVTGACAAATSIDSPHPPTPIPFATDGCTCYPDGPIRDATRWAQACVRYDYVYWRGGSWAERLAADEALRDAVAEAGHPVHAHLMFCGTRLGGLPFWPTPWRWGFAWSWPRPYQTLSAAEHAALDAIAPEEAPQGPTQAAASPLP